MTEEAPGPATLFPAPFHTQTLEQAIAYWAACAPVMGLLEIGARARQSLHAASDYDLVLVVTGLEQPWVAGVTQIDGRFTDLLFVAGTALDRLLALGTALARSDPLAAVVPWVRDGRIRYDADGRLARVKNKLQTGSWLAQPGDQAAFDAWFAINYNLAQAQRMAKSDDPLYRQALDVRMAVYGYSDIWFGYFAMRKLVWTGDKDAVAYLQSHDPEFLDAYQTFVATTDPVDKLARYAEVADRACAPLGGLWPDAATVLPVAWLGSLLPDQY